MSCSDYISPSKSPFDKMKDIKMPVPELIRPPTTAHVTMTTHSCDDQHRHEPPCPLEKNSILISSVKYDYDPASLLAASESVIGPDYDPALYDTVEVAEKHSVKDESTNKTEDYDSGISSPSSSSPPDDSIDIKIAVKKRRRKRRRGTTLAGASFEDCYERTGRILGSGAFSQVELCRCIRTGHEFAVKVIKKDTWYNGYTRARVHQEVEILYRCTGHPNIVQLQDFYEGKEEFYLVFEMMRGGALIDHIEKRKTFNERQASTVLYCITSALQHLHSAGIAHRDLKFDNLLCNDPEDFTQVKICDFDLGGQKLDIPYLSTPLLDSPVGSAEFMAPEVVDLFVGHKSTYDKRCDMWSLGITLYIMLFGRPPFTGRCGLNCGWDDGEACAVCQELLFQNITSGRITFPPESSVSESAKDLIKRLLVKDARKRYTASQVLEHPWVTGRGTDNVLETPANLRRNTLSAANLGNFAAKANEHYRYLNSGLNGLSEALDNLNLAQQLELEGEKKEEESTPELTPTTDKADFFISDEDDWYNIT
ncbi:hypothetical protein ACHWQZ_G016147 [Mnemiopsis leidyi]